MRASTRFGEDAVAPGEGLVAIKKAPPVDEALSGHLLSRGA